MKYSQIIILLTLLTIPLISAGNVGIVIDFPDGSTHIQCLTSNNNENGYDLLNKISLNTIWAGPGSFGHQLCQVNGIGDTVSGTGCSFSGKYWRFLSLINNQWEYLPVGFDAGDSCWNNNLASFDGHYCSEEGDVIGLSYGEFSDPRPSVHTFNDICNPLTITEVKVYVDGKRESSADEDGGDIDAEPGDELEFKITLENTYEFDENIEIENIEAEITIIDIDDGSDLDDNVNFKDLEFEEDERETISITIPLVLEDDDYKIELKITGETDDLEQETIINYDLNIDKEKHDLKFSKLILDVEESCPNTNNLLSLEVSNTGERDEPDTRISIKNEDLNIDFTDRFDIDEGDADDTYKKEIPFQIPNLLPGDYKININLDYSEISREDITLTIKDCNQAPITGNTISENKITSTKITQATPNNQVFQTQTFLKNYSIPILLAIFLFFLIVAIVYIISIL